MISFIIYIKKQGGRLKPDACN